MDKKIPCAACLMNFSNKSLLPIRLECTCTYVQRYRCNSCRFITSDAEMFGRHKTNHLIAANSPFRCGKCGKNYLSRNHLARHQKYECGVEPKFQCPYCPYRCKIKGNLGSHVRRRHPNREQVL